MNQSILLGIVHKLISRRIKDAICLIVSFKCSINFHRGQNVLIRRPSSCKDLNKTDESINIICMGENRRNNT